MGERLGAAGEFGHRIVGRVEPVGGGIFQPRDHRFGARVELAVGDPQRRVIARGIKLDDRLAFAGVIEAVLDLLEVTSARSRSPICASLAENILSICP